MNPRRITFRESLDYGKGSIGAGREKGLSRFLGAGLLYLSNRFPGEDKTTYPGWSKVIGGSAELTEPAAQPFREGDSWEQLAALAASALETGYESDGKTYIQIPFEDAVYCLYLSGSIWANVGGKMVRPNEYVSEILTEKLNRPVHVMGGSSKIGPEDGAVGASMSAIVGPTDQQQHTW